MPFETENRNAVVAYLQAGGKGSAPCEKLGVEVEHFVVHASSRRAVSYQEEEGSPGVRDVLGYLARFYPECSYGTDGELLGLASNSASLTLEPAAQLEISIAPFARVADIVQVYQEFRHHVEPYLTQHGYEIVTLGYHPVEKASNLSLIPKQRYHFMDDYFYNLGTHGERMMRASASTQVSVDYADEADAIRKMRIAQTLVPLFAFLTDNIERFEGTVPQKPLSRFFMWRNVDNGRCGQVPGLFRPDFSFEVYADWLLSTCPIFVTRPAAEDPDGPSLRSVVGQTAYQAYGDAVMTQADIEHLLSMFWPDVRFKRFVEIRPADALPTCAMAGYVALIKGIFCNEQALSRIEEACGVRNGIWPLDDASAERAARTIQEEGLQVRMGELTLQEWKDMLFDLARQALCPDEQSYLDDFIEWAERKA